MSLPAKRLARRDAFRIAVLAGVVLPLSAAPFDLPILAFLFAPMLAVALERDEAAGGTLRSAARLGFASGFFAHVVTFAWFGPMIVVHGRLPHWVAALASVLLFAAQALPYAYAATLARMASRAGVRPTIALPLAIAIAFALAPMMFPFRPSTPVVELLPFVQMADVGGETLVDLVTAAFGCAAFEALRTRRPLAVAVAAALFVAPYGYGLARIAEIEAARADGREIRVGLVQPNISIADKQSIRTRRMQMRTLRALTADAERRGAQLVAWPETSYPYRIERTRTRDAVGDPSLRRGGLVRGPVIFGVVTGTTSCDQHNSTVGMSRTGAFTRPVDKARLLPLVETFPGWESSRVLRRIRPCFGYRAAPRAAVLEVDGYRAGIMNCYEDLLGVHARELAALDPDFLLNLTNDAWFLDSQEPHLHHMASRYRAIEIRRDLVRTVNTGVTGHISATGARLAQTRTYEATALVVPVRVVHETTLFARHGDLVRELAIGILLAASLLATVRRSAAQTEQA